jgi:hypothetical protein
MGFITVLVGRRIYRLLRGCHVWEALLLLLLIALVACGGSGSGGSGSGGGGGGGGNGGGGSGGGGGGGGNGAFTAGRTKYVRTDATTEYFAWVNSHWTVYSPTTNRFLPPIHIPTTLWFSTLVHKLK